MNDSNPVVIELSPQMLVALNRLLQVMGTEKFLQLADLLRDVATDHGYGDVKIVIVDHAVKWLRAEKSYE